MEYRYPPHLQYLREMIVQVAPVHQVQDEAELVRGVEGVGHAYNEWTVVACHNTNHLSTEHDPDVIVFRFQRRRIYQVSINQSRI